MSFRHIEPQGPLIQGHVWVCPWCLGAFGQAHDCLGTTENPHPARSAVEMVRPAIDIEAERDRYRRALERIRDHGETHDEPCWALHQGDCADVMQEYARAALDG